MDKLKKIHRQTTERIIDEDGVIKETTIDQVAYVDREPDYVKLYITDIMKLSNIPKSCNTVLMALLKKSNYDNEIILIKAVREDICKTLSIADSTFRKAVDEFISKGILTKKSKGVYVANPFLFGRGSWNSIKRIRLQVDYNEHGRFIMKQSTDQKELEFTGENRPAIRGVRFNDKIENSGTEIYYID